MGDTCWTVVETLDGQSNKWAGPQNYTRVATLYKYIDLYKQILLSSYCALSLDFLAVALVARLSQSVIRA